MDRIPPPPLKLFFVEPSVYVTYYDDLIRVVEILRSAIHTVEKNERIKAAYTLRLDKLQKLYEKNRHLAKTSGAISRLMHLRQAEQQHNNFNEQYQKESAVSRRILYQELQEIWRIEKENGKDVRFVVDRYNFELAISKTIARRPTAEITDDQYLQEQLAIAFHAQRSETSGKNSPIRKARVLEQSRDNPEAEGTQPTRVASSATGGSTAYHADDELSEALSTFTLSTINYPDNQSLTDDIDVVQNARSSEASRNKGKGKIAGEGANVNDGALSEAWRLEQTEGIQTVEKPDDEDAAKVSFDSISTYHFIVPGLPEGTPLAISSVTDRRSTLGSLYDLYGAGFNNSTVKDEIEEAEEVSHSVVSA
ncbi:hypothetical protein CPC08DRAFT_766481 [Agrocybe pediades]|nr:hypothetical protein CPC08DRAFT_766481 [Agrocybe pediades]